MLKWFKNRELSQDTTETETPAEGNAVAGAEGASSAADTAVQEPNSTSAANSESMEDSKTGLFSRLRSRLHRTQTSLAKQIRTAIGLKDKIDEQLLEEIEEILIRGDVGTRSASSIVNHLRKEGRRREVYEAGALIELVKEAIVEILSRNHRNLEIAGPAPRVILVVGVNGTGKTTTIGKLAMELVQSGRSVMMIAADTFRAAAVDQLRVWAERTGSCLVAQDEGADPGSVCFEGLSGAKQSPPDVVLIDTAGRLHTKKHLMNELGKVIRVIKKVYPDAPHETVLVLDATTGQNALNQVATFKEVANLTGLVMTKLDGTAKGGILIALKESHPDLPILKIGIGEEPGDLRDFDPSDFAEALFAGEN